MNFSPIIPFWEETVIIMWLCGLNIVDLLDIIGGLRTYEGFCFSG